MAPAGAAAPLAPTNCESFAAELVARADRQSGISYAFAGLAGLRAVAIWARVSTRSNCEAP